jgi:glycosyltransferase involved in cell wall biosynthesis
MRVFYYSEDLSYPFDEGIKKTAKNVLLTLLKSHEVIASTRYGIDDETLNLQVIRSNKLLVNKVINKRLLSFKPEAIVYLPSASATLPSFLRMRILKSYFPKAKTIMINLQPKTLNLFEKIAVNYIKPNATLTPSSTVENQFKKLKIDVTFFPLYTDLKNFTTYEDSLDKITLRKKYGIPLDKYIITHIGHINYGRNLEALIPLQKGNNQIVVVGSSSTPTDAPKELGLKSKLKEKGVLVLDGYIEDIQEVYKLSDLYIFPVIYEGGCIGVPLTILEARACGTKVLSTDYASIKRVFEGKDHEVVISSHNNFCNEVEKFKKNKQSVTSNGYSIINELNKQFVKKLNKALK